MQSHRPETVLVTLIAVAVLSASARADKPLFVFNSDGGAAAIAHVKGRPVRGVVCRELNELVGTGVTDFFWCPIVGGNVFIYPTKVGERIGDNIRDWDKIHPYYREQGRAMAANLRELIKGGHDPITMLAARAKEVKIRFWLTCRMNEIHEDDDRFMVVRSLFKEKNKHLLHGKNYHPEAVYAPIKGWSYAWDYGQEPVREHFLALFTEWLEYDIHGIELDYCRSPCLFPPGEEKKGAPRLTDFMVKLNGLANKAAKRHGHPVRIAVRVPPSLEKCRAAGIEIKTWIERGLVDLITPMDRGYFHPGPRLREFIALAKPKGVPVLGGIEPKVRNYRQSSRQTFAATSSFLNQGANGIYLFNYDCHRINARSSKFGGVLQGYTKEERIFLTYALNERVRRNYNKHYLISHDSGNRLAEKGGSRPLMCRLPIGKPKTFRMHVGDDLTRARSKRFVVRLKDGRVDADQLFFQINGQRLTKRQFRFEVLQPSKITEITLTDPPLKRGENTIQLGLKAGTKKAAIIRSIDFYVQYTSRPNPRPTTGRKRPVLGKQQLFAYVPQSLEIFIKEPRHVAERSDWPANLLRFQFPESLNAYDGNGRRMWEFSFEKSDHPWRVIRKAKEKTMGGERKNRVMVCEDRFDESALIRRTATWTEEQLNFQLMVQNLGDKAIHRIQTSMCLQRTAAPDYYDRGGSRTFVVTQDGLLPARQLAFHPQKMMFYGKVGQSLNLVKKESPRTLIEGAIFVVSRDERYVLCYAWRNADMVFMNRSGRTRCIHSELRLTNIQPQQRVTAQGVLFVQKGTLKKAYQRFLKWKKK